MTAARLDRPLEPHVANALAILLGAGSVVALAGAVRTDLPVIAIGGAMAAAALVALMAAGWLEGLLLVIVAVPLPAIISTDTLRVAAAAPVTALAVFAWLLSRGVSDSPVRTGRLPVLAAAALASAFILATAFATHPATSVRELANIGVLALFFIFAIDRFTSDPAALDRIVLLLTLLGAVVGVLAVLEMLSIIPGAFPRTGTNFNRAALGFGQPNGLGLFLAVVAPLAVHVARTGTGSIRPIGRVALAAVLFGLVASFSRGAWLALLAGTGMLVFARGLRFTLRIWLVAVTFIVFVDVVTGGALRDTVSRTIGDWVIEQRIFLQLAGLMMFLDHPILGVGPGGYADNLDRYGAQLPQLTDYLATPHNAYIQFAAETGILGLAAYLAFLFVMLRVAVRAARSAKDPHEASLRQSLLWSVAVVVFAGFVVWPYAHGTGQAVLAVMAGALAVRETGA